MLPWASPLEGCSRDAGVIGRPPVRASERPRRARPRSRSSSALPWRPGSSVPAWAEAHPAGEPAELAGPCVPDRPPSWLAPCPAGCPAGLRMPPTRPAPAPGGVPTPRGRRQVPHPVVCLHRDRVVIPSRSYRRRRKRPRALPAGRSHPKTLPASPRRAPGGVRRGASVRSLVSVGRILPGQGAGPQGPSHLHAGARRAVEIQRARRATSPGSPVARPSRPGGRWERGAGSPAGAGSLRGSSAALPAWAGAAAVAKLSGASRRPAAPVAVSFNPRGIVGRGGEDWKS